jgi:hypothetical protein
MVKKSIFLFLFYSCFLLYGTTLKQAFELAEAGEGYDKLVVLDGSQTYIGGLLIGRTYNNDQLRLEDEILVDVKIVGNGAVLDLQGEKLCISYCENTLDIEDCVIINGTVLYRGIEMDYHQKPSGSVSHCTIYNAIDYGLKTQYCGEGIQFDHNIVMNSISTGSDFIFISSETHEWIITGCNISASVQASPPLVTNNWSYHSDVATNTDSLLHFASL